MEPLQYSNNIILYHYPSILNGSIRNLKKIIYQIISEHNLTCSSLEYTFISDEELLEINKTHLNHDYYTDIISFDYGKQKIVDGDIYISIDRVKDNAKTHNASYKEELFRVIIHGCLHLCGHKDKTKSQKNTMTKMENHYIKELIKLFHVERKK